MYSCNAIDGDLTASFNFTEIPDGTKYLVEIPESATEFYIYNGSSITEDNVCIYVTNNSGTWNYGDVTPGGVTPTCISTNTSLFSGTFNITGVSTQSGFNTTIYYKDESPDTSYEFAVLTSEFATPTPPVTPTGGLTGTPATLIPIVILGMILVAVFIALQRFKEQKEVSLKDIIMGAILILIVLVLAGVAAAF